ncbi:ABC transporter permease [Candidatus Nitrosoglobus terrae]|uniref:ABC transporter permease n=1 Tax=Candidatus Nitrosoglobus terrae TaxID=1630141 RepID=A0A1Q2SN18_9GAMM|nr:ABC transporter permease [Candidatus Nitrosoglobus terrae]BAW80538.1 ABC transporter permease [Candidatus Nitrosoglobus terrae]
MSVPYTYIFRNLWARKLTTLLTAIGMALVVFVFATVLMLSAGLEETLVATGSPNNVIVIRHSAETEVQSTIDRAQAGIIATLPNIAYGSLGETLVSKELIVLNVLPKRHSGKPSNVTIRGISSTGLTLRPQIHLHQGRLFHSGTREIMIGNNLVQSFVGTHIGEKLYLGLNPWTIVGIFDAGKTAFSSEIWGDVNQLMQAFRRDAYSSVIFKLADPEAFEQTKQLLENDQRLTIEAKRETQFYAEQSEMMSRFLKVLRLALSIIFSMGATIGAMITMYASVANRTIEIGTLRAIGFPRRNILQAFLLESLTLSLMGGIPGLIMASFMQLLTISTMNWKTFSELAFSFTLTKTIVWQSLLFSLFMGLVGGFLPAARAARMNIIEALRAA